MSKKKLLSEAQVKRFMGLAGLNPINENYMDENMYEEEKEAPMMEAEEEVEIDDEMPPMADEESEMGPEEEPEMEDGAADVEMDEQDLADVADALSVLQDKLGPLLDQATPGEEEVPADMDMDAEEPEMDADLEDVDVEPSPEEEEEMQERIVNEVARRVAKRIVEAKRAHKKMNEALGRKK